MMLVKVVSAGVQRGALSGWATLARAQGEPML